MSTTPSPSQPDAHSDGGQSPRRRKRRIWLWISLVFATLGLITCGAVIVIAQFLKTPIETSARFATDSIACEELYQKGDFKAALEACSRAIEASPTHAPSYVTRGYLYLLDGDYQAALADCSKAIELDPTSWQAYINRGIVYEKLNNIDALIENYDEMLSKDVDGTAHRYFAYNNRGIGYAKKGDTDRAVRDFVRAIEQQPEFPEAYENIERIYLSSNDIEGVIQVYTELADRLPESADILYHRGTIYRKGGQQIQALADFRACLEREPSELLRNQAEDQIASLEQLLD